MLTPEKVIDLTVENINKNGICKIEGFCKYYLDGNMCAVGFWLKNAEDFKDYKGCSYDLFHKFGTDILKEEVQHLPVEFWEELQYLHDEACNYDDGKLIDDVVIRLKRNYS